jgi:hypothetical protein
MLALLSGACAGSPSESESHLLSTEVPASSLPDQGLGPGAYHHSSPSASPESLLAVLRNTGIRVREAWAPLDNQCMDPIGPTFTVVVAPTDGPRLGRLGFLPGEGRLLCATTLRHYYPRPAAG